MMLISFVAWSLMLGVWTLLESLGPHIAVTAHQLPDADSKPQSPELLQTPMALPKKIYSMKMIITAPGIDNKFLNKLAVEICDHETWNVDDDRERKHAFIIQLSRDDEEGFIDLFPPMEDYDESKNDFLNCDIKDVEEYARKRMEEHLFVEFVLIDDRAKREGHCVVVSRAMFNEEEDDYVEGTTFTDHFEKTRVPVHETWSMMANLDIANLGFEEYTDDEHGNPVLDEESGLHWYKYTFRDQHALPESEAAASRRNASMERLREQGLI